MKTTPAASSQRSGLTAAGLRSAESAPSARIAPPTGRVAPPVKAATPTPSTNTSGRREPVEAEQRGHHGERAPDENGVPVSLSSARDRQYDGAGRRDPGPERDAAEVDPATDEDLLAADEVEERSRDDRRERSRRQQRNRAGRHGCCIGTKPTIFNPRRGVLRGAAEALLGASARASRLDLAVAGGAAVTSSASRCCVTWAISSTARANAASFAFDGFCEPLTLRTYWSAAARTSSSVAGGSKLWSVLMFRHMSVSSSSGWSRRTR